MTLRTTARAFACGLLILATLAGCKPSAAPAATENAPAAETSIVLPTHTPRPTRTVRPTRTPTAEVTATPEGASPATPAAGAATPAAGAGAAQPTAAANNPAQAGKSTALDKYEYLGQDIADKSQFLPNRTVTITWTVKNVGPTGWTKEYALRYFSGPKASKDVYYFTKDVPAKDTINFIVTFTTPADPGTYDMWFKLTNSQGQNFGDLDLVYTVSNNPVKVVPTAAK